MAITEMLFEKYGATLTPDNTAEVLGCHPTHVRILCANGELPGVKIGSRWFIPTVKLAELLETGGIR